MTRLTASLLCILSLAFGACQGLQAPEPFEPEGTLSETSEASDERDSGDATEDALASVPEEVAEPEEIPEPEQGPAVYRFLVDVLTLPWESPEGVAPGFDLDGIQSDGFGSSDCGWEDFASAEGDLGIDNQLARLTPLFEPAGLGQAFEYLENSIEDSGFFLLFELRGVDDLGDDDEIELIYELGGGSGLMDTEGRLVAHQTMCVQNDSPHLFADEATIVDGFLEARFEVLTFTFSMFERVYPFVFYDTRIRARLTSDGHIVDGVIGGTLAMSNLLDLTAKGAQNTGGLLGPMTALLTPLGDMPSADGECSALSGALDFSAVPVFFFPPESDCDPCGNGTCEYFESCETCLEDCCAGCGNGQCDVYPSEEYAVTIGGEGFDLSALSALVGDTVHWENATDGPLNLLCDGALGNRIVDTGETYKSVVTESGVFNCRVHELPGQLHVLTIDDNQSENCQSCPLDCGECE